MRLKTILLTTVATGTLMCEPVMAYAVDSTPDSMGWFRKKKKSEPNDSVKSLKSATSLTKCYRLKRNVLLIRNPPIQSARPFQCAYHPLTP